MSAEPLLHMLSFRPDMDRLMRLAVREHLLPHGGDLGYALHAAFAASFAGLAPKPFVLLPPGTQGREWRLLTYSNHSLDDLRAQAAAFGDPDFLAPFNIETAASKTMPSTFGQDARFAFRLRVRPVVRTGKPKTENATSSEDCGKLRAKEIDAYQAAVLVGGKDSELSRGKVYANWLNERLRQSGAVLETASLDAFKRVSLMTRDRSNGGKSNKQTEGPDATMSGILRIIDPLVFTTALARGVGRHRAFGFGMLLLAPPR